MSTTVTRVAFLILGATILFPTFLNTTNNFLQYSNSGRLPVIAQLFGNYCPGISLCTTNQSGSPANVRWCCYTCSCSLKCFQEGNCCPDVLQYTNESLKKTCVRPQYLAYGVTNSSARKSYYFIHTCLPNFGDMTIVKNCEIIPQNPRNLEDFLSTLPVSRVNSSLSYRNIHCALCNGESLEDLVRWTIELACNSRNDLLTASFDELLYVLNRYKICNLLYRAPFHMGVMPRYCNWGDITSCNQTGNMESYNENLVDMCGAFTSVYVDRYRNVFCYLCNKNVQGGNDCPEYEPITGGFDIMSFTAILDFRILSSTVPSPPPDTEKCLFNQRYDRYKDVCRNMTCAAGSINVDGECKRQYTSEAIKSYDVYFRITPEQDFCVASLDLFGTELSMSVFSTLNGSSPLRNSICSFAPLFMPGNEDCDGKNSSSSVTYALIHVGIYLSVVHSVDQVLTELSLLDNSLIVVGSQRSTVTIDSRYYGEIAFDSLISTRRYTDPDTKEMILELASYYLIATTCLSPVRHLRVRELTYCRRLILPPDEYSITFHEGSVCLEMINLCLTNGTYELKQNGLEMCQDIYFTHVQNLSRVNSTTNVCNDSELDAFGIVSIISTSISIFSLVLVITTYSLFKSLRTTPGKNNMFLSVNLLIAQCLLQFGSGQRSLGVGCVVIGVLVHYFWLSAVVWTNICSFHMFSVFSSLKAKTMSSLRDEKRRMATYIMYSVLTPLVVVAVNILVNLVTSDWSDIGYGGCVCYISSKHMILYTFAIPIFVILLLNIIYFVIVVIAIRRSQHSKLSSNKDHISILVYVKLSCLTGASWIFGFLYIWKNYDDFGYIFIILTAGQGIFIFLSFICSKRVLKLYSGLMRCPSPNEIKSSSGTNKSGVSYLSTHPQNNLYHTTRM